MDLPNDIILPQWLEINPDVHDDLVKLLTTERPRRKTTPKGYKPGTDSSGKPVSIPDPDVLLDIVRVFGEYRHIGSRSLRESQAMINKILLDKTGDEVGLATAGGAAHLFTRLEQDLNLSLSETSKQRLQRVRKERTEKRRAEGHNRTYNFSFAEEKKIGARKILKQTQKEIEELEKKKKSLTAKAARQARKMEKAGDPLKIEENDPIKLRSRHEATLKKFKQKLSYKRKKFEDEGLVETYIRLLGLGVRPDNEDYLLEVYRKITSEGLTMSGRSIGFLPSPRQNMFLSSSEDIVLYGGAAGGGKSFVMVADPLRYAHIKYHNAVIIRKTMPELNELIDVSRELYPIAFPGAKYKETDHTWYFPSGGKIRFGYLDKPADKYKYQGKAFTYIGFDELSQHDTPEGFNYLRSRLRRPKRAQAIKPFIRATANPGSQWVYEMFIQPAEPNTPFIMKGTENSSHPVTMRFIPSNLRDNPHLDDDGLYRSMLESLPEVERRQLLEGDWSASNDSMFPEFDIRKHVIDPFFVPKHWTRVAGLDYGYRDPSAGVWFAVDPQTGDLIVYDEFCQSGLTGREFALEIKEKEKEELVPVDHPIDWSIFARTGHTGPTIAESMYTVPGFRLKRADKNREAGWVQIHEVLRPDPETGAPKMRIFSTCKGLIKQLMASKVHPNKPGDLNDTRSESTGHWDLLDALRYGVMSRPRKETFENRLTNLKKENSWSKYQGYFS